MIGFAVFAPVALALFGMAGSGVQVDVRDFGAACNGSTDDSEALQASLDAVPSGGTVNIPCKLAVGSSGVLLANKNDVTVTGTAPGAGIRVLAPTGQSAQGFSSVALLVQFCANCTISNLEFDGNSVAAVPLGLDRCGQNVIENNFVHDVGDVAGGIVSAGSRNNRYVRNRIVNTTINPNVSSRGMWIGNVNPSENEWHPYIAQNTLQNISATGIATHAIGATIAFNTVDTTLGAGIKVTQPPGNSDVTLVENNLLRRNQFHGIQIDGGHHMTITGNICEQNTHNGIFTVNGFRNSKISGNTLRDNNFGGSKNWAAGLWIEALAPVEDITVDDNQTYDSRSGSDRTQDLGIMLYSNDTPAGTGNIRNVAINRNVCNNGRFSGIGIQTVNRATVDSVTVAGNICSSNSSYGLWVHPGTDGSISNVVQTGNTFEGNGRGAMDGSGVISRHPPVIRIPDPGHRRAERSPDRQ